MTPKLNPILNTCKINKRNAEMLLPSRGSLHTRSLTGIVKKEDLVLNSEYLTTLLVVVPRLVFVSGV